ncbi:MFS transporter, partial [Acinetobacter baumannii]|nr:MFS transporter [Acinetobacter baumannii]
WFDYFENVSIAIFSVEYLLRLWSIVERDPTQAAWKQRLGGALQTRLMDVAGDAQTLAASLNHSAFNLANALGAFLGGWVLSHQMGWIAPIWVGFVLSLGGLIILLIAFAVEKATQKA